MNKEQLKQNKVIKSRRRHERYLREKRQGKPRKKVVKAKASTWAQSPPLSFEVKQSWWRRLLKLFGI